MSDTEEVPERHPANEPRPLDLIMHDQREYIIKTEKEVQTLWRSVDRCHQLRRSGREIYSKDLNTLKQKILDAMSQNQVANQQNVELIQTISQLRSGQLNPSGGFRAWLNRLGLRNANLEPVITKRLCPNGKPIISIRFPIKPGRQVANLTGAAAAILFNSVRSFAQQQSRTPPSTGGGGAGAGGGSGFGTGGGFGVEFGGHSCGGFSGNSSNSGYPPPSAGGVAFTRYTGQQFSPIAFSQPVAGGGGFDECGSSGTSSDSDYPPASAGGVVLSRYTGQQFSPIPFSQPAIGGGGCGYDGFSSNSSDSDYPPASAGGVVLSRYTGQQFSPIAFSQPAADDGGCGSSSNSSNSDYPAAGGGGGVAFSRYTGQQLSPIAFSQPAANGDGFTEINLSNGSLGPGPNAANLSGLSGLSSPGNMSGLSGLSAPGNFNESWSSDSGYENVGRIATPPRVSPVVTSTPAGYPKPPPLPPFQPVQLRNVATDREWRQKTYFGDINAEAEKFTGVGWRYVPDLQRNFDMSALGLGNSYGSYDGPDDDEPNPMIPNPFRLYDFDRYYWTDNTFGHVSVGGPWSPGPDIARTPSPCQPCSGTGLTPPSVGGPWSPGPDMARTPSPCQPCSGAGRTPPSVGGPWSPGPDVARTPSPCQPCSGAGGSPFGISGVGQNFGSGLDGSGLSNNFADVSLGSWGEGSPGSPGAGPSATSPVIASDPAGGASFPRPPPFPAFQPVKLRNVATDREWRQKAYFGDLNAESEMFTGVGWRYVPDLQRNFDMSALGLGNSYGSYDGPDDDEANPMIPNPFRLYDFDRYYWTDDTFGHVSVGGPWSPGPDMARTPSPCRPCSGPGETPPSVGRPWSPGPDMARTPSPCQPCSGADRSPLGILGMGQNLSGSGLDGRGLPNNFDDGLGSWAEGSPVEGRVPPTSPAGGAFEDQLLDFKIDPSGFPPPRWCALRRAPGAPPIPLCRPCSPPPVADRRLAQIYNMKSSLLGSSLDRNGLSNNFADVGLRSWAEGSPVANGERAPPTSPWAPCATSGETPPSVGGPWSPQTPSFFHDCPNYRNPHLMRRMETPPSCYRYPPLRRIFDITRTPETSFNYPWMDGRSPGAKNFFSGVNMAGTPISNPAANVSEISSIMEPGSGGGTGLCNSSELSNYQLADLSVSSGDLPPGINNLNVSGVMEGFFADPQPRNVAEPEDCPPSGSYKTANYMTPTPAGPSAAPYL